MFMHIEEEKNTNWYFHAWGLEKKARMLYTFNRIKKKSNCKLWRRSTQRRSENPKGKPQKSVHFHNAVCAMVNEQTHNHKAMTKKTEQFHKQQQQQQQQKRYHYMTNIRAISTTWSEWHVTSVCVCSPVEKKRTTTAPFSAKIDSVCETELMHCIVQHSTKIHTLTHTRTNTFTMKKKI